MTEFKDSAVVVLGHGTTLNPYSEKPVLQHVAELRRRGEFAEVREAFWKQEPRIQDVLASLEQRRVFIVPLFISEGYFCEQVIPEALGFRRAGEPAGFCRVLNREGQEWRYCRPVGTHRSMTMVLRARAEDIARQFPFPRPPRLEETTLLIAGHGTGQNENSRRAAEDQAKLLGCAGVFAEVRAVFMEEEPYIRGCEASCRTRNVIVVPFFISDGLHAQEDIPVLLGTPERIVRERLATGRPAWRNPTEKGGKLIWYTKSIGGEPHVADVIVQLAKDSAEHLV